MNIDCFDFEDRKHIERFIGELYNNQNKEIIEEALNEHKCETV